MSPIDTSSLTEIRMTMRVRSGSPTALTTPDAGLPRLRPRRSVSEEKLTLSTSSRLIGQLHGSISGHLSKTLTELRILLDRKSTRLNSSHLGISYAVFCLKKKRQ